MKARDYHMLSIFVFLATLTAILVLGGRVVLYVPTGSLSSNSTIEPESNLRSLSLKTPVKVQQYRESRKGEVLEAQP